VAFHNKLLLSQVLFEACRKAWQQQRRKRTFSRMYRIFARKLRSCRCIYDMRYPEDKLESTRHCKQPKRSVHPCQFRV
jgi:hypothetical protein